MNEESRKKHKENIQNNCGTCIHKDVCSYKLAYDSAVSRVIHEAQADFYLIEVCARCKCYIEHDTIHDLQAELYNAKSEAVREFADRLKDKVSYFPCAMGDYKEYLTIDVIDNLVNKMVGKK